jgi:prenyl protein peptidase
MELTPHAAMALAVAVAWGYVGVLGLLPQRLRQLPRDHPEHVSFPLPHPPSHHHSHSHRAAYRTHPLPPFPSPQLRGRIIAVSIFSLVAPLPVLLFLGGSHLPPTPSPLSSPLALLGLAPACNGLGSVLWPLGVTILLFAGPLLELALDVYDEAEAEADSGGAGILRALPSVCARRGAEALRAVRTLQRVRDLVVAPVTEEWVFRACIVPLLLSPAGAGLTLGQTLVVAPALFGTAHVHHYLELRKAGKAASAAALTVCVQFAYTSLFGALSVYFYSRTWSVLAACLPHAFCNYLGAPQFGFLRGGDGGTAGGTSRRVVLGLAYVCGIAAFVWAAGAAAADEEWLSACGKGGLRSPSPG